MHKGLILETAIRIPAPVAAVWEGLTAPEMIKQYFFGTQLITTWKVGEPIIFRGEWEGVAYEDKGTVLAFEPLQMLKYNYWSSMGGLTDIPENYANITYAVHAEGADTIVTITQDNIETEEKRAHSEQNWQFMMKALGDLLKG